MKLKIKEFGTLARQNGYRNGKALMKKLGAGKCAYGCLKRGCKIGYDLVKESTTNSARSSCFAS